MKTYNLEKKFGVTLSNTGMSDKCFYRHLRKEGVPSLAKLLKLINHEHTR